VTVAIRHCSRYIGRFMLLDLSKIRTPHVAFDETYKPEQFPASDDQYTIVHPVQLHLDIAKTGERFRLTGRVQTVLELPCSRCLDPFTWPVDAAFDLVYHPHSANVGEGELEVEDEDLSTAFYEDQRIDLAQLIREQLYLALPMKPLCGDECRGLCPVCGTNLNRGSCDCHRGWDDPRLAVLKNIKLKGD
jgi:uncharacterized protein